MSLPLIYQPILCPICKQYTDYLGQDENDANTCQFGHIQSNDDYIYTSNYGFMAYFRPKNFIVEIIDFNEYQEIIQLPLSSIQEAINTIHSHFERINKIKYFI